MKVNYSQYFDDFCSSNTSSAEAIILQHPGSFGSKTGHANGTSSFDADGIAPRDVFFVVWC